MRNDTRKLFTGYLGQVAKLNGVESAGATFNVDPSVQQKLETKIQESSEFLGKINIIGVDEQEGEKVGLGVGSTIAGRSQLRSLHDQLRQGLVRREQQIEVLKRENSTLRDWATQPLPDIARRLRERPALTGADAYRQWLSGGGSVPIAGDPPKP